MKVLLVLAIFTSCASGKIDYTPPKKQIEIKNKKVVNLSFNKAWNKLIEKISETAHSISNMNKDSGFLNINYSLKDPEQYLDCGRFVGSFSGPRKKEKYDFSAAIPNKKYSFVTPPNNVQTYDRTTQLSGATNLYLKKLSNNKSELKVNIKYILEVSTNITYMNNNYQWITTPSKNSPYTVDFNTNSKGSAQPKSNVECISNGKLEELFLNML